LFPSGPLSARVVSGPRPVPVPENLFSLGPVRPKYSFGSLLPPSGLRGPVLPSGVWALFSGPALFVLLVSGLLCPCHTSRFRPYHFSSLRSPCSISARPPAPPIRRRRSRRLGALEGPAAYLVRADCGLPAAPSLRRRGCDYGRAAQCRLRWRLTQGPLGGLGADLVRARAAAATVAPRGCDFGRAGLMGLW